MPTRKPDVNQTASRLVREATGAGKVRGEDLIGSERLKKGFLAAKKKAKSR